MRMEDEIPSTPEEAAYTPIRVLGRGAFGEAVLYRKVVDNSLVVWKEVDLKRLSDKERRDAQNEIDILSILSHENIISYYNHFLDGETLLIEMEYANGGNLHEKIVSQEELFHEETVLWYFYQVVSATAHIHDYGILHRDIKSLNIFLTKAGLVKLGDFGISKMLESTSEMAQSYVGTPYYMSPELIKGEQYNQKSDIWACGCVLYELLTLSKVFNASNPLKLASEIVRNDFEDISPKYSDNLRDVLHLMLNKDPTVRPKANDVLNHPVFTNIGEELKKQILQLNSSHAAKMTTAQQTDVLPVVTSKTSEVYFWGGGKRIPQKLDLFVKGKSSIHVAAGNTHFAVVTVERELYTWMNGQGVSEMNGQLGHGDVALYKAPKKVEALEGVPIRQAECGEDFTICVTDEGGVYSFGSDYYGCLGCDQQEGDRVCTPVLIDFFSTRPVQQIACGDAHVVALTKAGEVYTWGCGEFGRLGLGSEDDYYTPQKVTTQSRHGIKSVYATPTGSFLLRTNGRVQACGCNEHNELGLNCSAKGIRKRKQPLSYDIPCTCKFTTVKALSKYNIISLSSGNTHTAVIDVFGRLITFGANESGQLGVGDTKPRKGVNEIGGALTGQRVNLVTCGDRYTVIATSDNLIYSWGLCENGRLGSAETTGMCSTLPRTIFGSLHAVSNISSKYWNTILVAEKVVAQKTIRSSTSLLVKGGAELDACESPGADDIFESSEQTSSSGDSGINHSSLGGTTESSVPPWLKAELQESEFIPVEGDSPKQKTPDMTSSAPTWLRAELAESEFIPVGGAQTPANGDIQGVSPSSDEVDGGGLSKQPMVPSLQLGSLGRSDTNGRPPLLNISSRNSTCKSEPSDTESVIQALRDQLSTLNKQNLKLESLVQHQAETIQAQSETIQHLEEKLIINREVSEEIWNVVDRWEYELAEARDNAVYPVVTPDVNTPYVEMRERMVRRSGHRRSQSVDPDYFNQNVQEYTGLIKIDPVETKHFQKFRSSSDDTLGIDIDCEYENEADAASAFGVRSSSCDILTYVDGEGSDVSMTSEEMPKPALKRSSLLINLKQPILGNKQPTMEQKHVARKEIFLERSNCDEKTMFLERSIGKSAEYNRRRYNSRSYMMKSYKPNTIARTLKGVTTEISII